MKCRAAGWAAALSLLALPACSEQTAPDPTNVINEDTLVSGPVEPETAQPVASAAGSACQPAVFEEVPLTVCTATPDEHRIGTALYADNGKPFRNLATYAAHRPADAPLVAFAMNAGKFDDAGKPVGYYVENSERLEAMNRGEGTGDFYSKPNGVFFGANGKWQILSTQEFFDSVSERPDFGTQSGPLLVMDGELHPDIKPDGETHAKRNAVGIDSAGRAIFVISDAPLSFGKLARYYRDVLKVRYALYLDGKISALWDPESNRMDHGEALGPLIVVEKRAKAAE